MNEATEYVAMSELKVGDVVHTHGLRVRLVALKGEWFGMGLRPHSGQETAGKVRSFVGKVINPEVFEKPKMRHLFGGLIDFEDPHWDIQSIEFYMWSREV